MSYRPICKRGNCTNLARISRTKNEVISYASLCHTHSTEVSRTTINERLRTYGWSIEKTLTQGAK